MSLVFYLLSPRGFCSGVMRAVNMAEQVLKLYRTVYITEDIIHNKMLMNDLISRGMIKVDSIDEIPYGSTVMFSAHGISPKIVENAEKKELTIIDGTCPIVKTIQDSAKINSINGKKIIIIGNRSHPEIIALLGYITKNDAFVVYNEMDIDLLPDFSNSEVVYFTQTTLDPYSIEPIISSLKARIPHIKSDSQNNICYATKERQAAVRKIANSVDLLIVVGSAYSSNGMRLLEVATDSGIKKVVRIDSKDQLNLDLLDNVSNIAITSAASTPEFLVEELVEFLKEKKGFAVENFELSKNDCGK